MSISFACSNCGKQLVAKDSAAGSERTCPQCRYPVKVPRAEDVPKGDHPALLMSSGAAKHEDLIDMTAMVDIVFFILIFFMVTSLQALESVIGLPTPQTDAESPTAQVVPDFANDPSYVTVSIEADDSVWVEDEQVFGPQDLRVKLRELGDTGVEPTGMMVVGHPEASHGTLVMVLDAGADAGFADLKFSVSENQGGM